MKLVSASGSGLVSRPWINIVEPSQKCKEILRNIYDSEELIIDLNGSKAIAKTIEKLCATGNSAFNYLYSEVTSDKLICTMT